MESIELLLDSRTWYALVAYAAITGVLNLIVSERSRIDAWAESRPKPAAVLKVLRAIGFDPWHVIAALSLFFRSKLPEASKRDVSSKPPKGPSGTSSIGVASIAIAILLTGCGGFSWPRVVESCAPAPSTIVDEVADVLRNEPGSLSDRAVKALEELGKRHGASTILCVVNELVDMFVGKVGASPEEMRIAARGREFLRRVDAKVKP